MMVWMVLRHLWQVKAREGTGTATMEQKGFAERDCAVSCWDK